METFACSPCFIQATKLGLARTVLLIVLLLAMSSIVAQRLPLMSTKIRGKRILSLKSLHGVQEVVILSSCRSQLLKRQAPEVSVHRHFEPPANLSSSYRQLSSRLILVQSILHTSTRHSYGIRSAILKRMNASGRCLSA